MYIYILVNIFLSHVVLLGVADATPQDTQSLEEVLLGQGDIEKAIEMVDTQETTGIYKYLIKAIFQEKKKEALMDLLVENKEYFNHAYVASAIDNNIVFDSEENVAAILKEICRVCSEKYYKNSYLYKPKKMFKNVVERKKFRRKVKNIITMIYTGDKKSMDLFFAYIDSKKISIGEHVEVIKYLAEKGVARAYGYLGEIFFYGINVERSLSKAMEYYLQGKKSGDPMCYNGIGKVLMSEEYLDFTGAKQYLEMASSNGTLNETDYNIYLIFKNHLVMEQYGSFFLSKSLSMGYLPAIYKDGESYFTKKDYSSSIIRFNPILDFTDPVIEFQEKAEGLFKAEKYKQSLLVLLIAVELGSRSSLKNAIFLIHEYLTPSNKMMEKISTNNKMMEKILFYLYMRQLRQKDYTNINRIGDCYYYGRGVEQSYRSAFSLYLASACLDSDEGLLSTSWMYEHGLGVEKSLKSSVKYLLKIRGTERNYLLLMYAYFFFIVRVSFTSVIVKYAMVSVFSGYALSRIVRRLKQ